MTIRLFLGPFDGATSTVDDETAAIARAAGISIDLEFTDSDGRHAYVLDPATGRAVYERTRADVT